MSASRSRAEPSVEALLDEALRIAARLKDASDSATLQSYVVDVMALIDPDRALKVARTIRPRSEAAALHYPGARGRAFGAVARAFARTAPDKAIKIALRLSRADNRDLALRELACSLARHHPTNAPRAANLIESPAQRALALVQIGCRLPGDSKRAGRFIQRGLRTARRITDQAKRAWALGEMIEELDPRAVTYLRHAVQQALESARRISDDERAHVTVLDLLGAIAQHDAPAALDVGRAVKSETQRVWLLATIAAVVGDSDPARGRRIADEALKAARGIEKPGSRSWALSMVAESLTTIDLDRALSLARSIRDRDDKAAALEGIVDALAPTDPIRALRIARTIKVTVHRGWALQWVVWRLSERDPARALRVARSMQEQGGFSHRSSALRDVAAAFAWSNPRKAVAVARSIKDPFHRAWALTRIGRVMLEAARTRPA